MDSSPTTPATRSLRILIAPDSFKGTATATQAAEYLAEGVHSEDPEAEITLAPMADGGEGTADTFDGQRITLPTVDAAGRLTEATYVFDRESRTAYIDVAAASGLPAVLNNPVPLSGDTYGTGVLIADAETRGAQRIVLCLGGSATTDGGTGILAALGAEPLDAAGFSLPKGGASLVDLATIDTAQLNIKAAALDFVLLTDVISPATGELGAAHVYGPQKGADSEQVKLLDAAISRLCEVTEVNPEIPGTGAAGALPVGLLWLSTLLHGSSDHIHLIPGAPLIARSRGLEELIPDSDLVITGEGALDEQSFRGKVVGTIAGLAEGTAATLAVAAGKVNSAAPAGVLIAELIDSPDVAVQLREAGARLLRDYRRISTVQG
ncbi:glycerate kinase [Corynebacterium sp. A21]|uniref:glycerate kinase n=1 Tax=Corynebacterium sp. A21 TaxID=3457318 RepID=UPI003FD40DE9